MKRPMPLPESLNDYVLLDQMGYDVKMKNSRPVKVIKRRKLIKATISLVTGLIKNFHWYVLVTRHKLSVSHKE